MVTNTQIAIFWDVMPCGMLQTGNNVSEETNAAHLQCKTVYLDQRQQFIQNVSNFLQKLHTFASQKSVTLTFTGVTNRSQDSSR